MKHTVIVLLLVLLTGIACGEDQRRHDGFWWADLSESFKLGYVAGYGEAMVLNNDARFLQCLAAKNGGVVPEKYPGSEVIDECTKAADPQFDYSKIRIGQLQEGVDEFYKDFRNKAILITAALRYVRDQLRGKSDKELADRLERLRHAANSVQH